MTLFRDTEAGSFKIWFGWGFHKSKARFLKIRPDLLEIMGVSRMNAHSA